MSSTGPHHSGNGAVPAPIQDLHSAGSSGDSDFESDHELDKAMAGSKFAPAVPSTADVEATADAAVAPGSAAPGPGSVSAPVPPAGPVTSTGDRILLPVLEATPSDSVQATKPAPQGELVTSSDLAAQGSLTGTADHITLPAVVDSAPSDAHPNAAAVTQAAAASAAPQDVPLAAPQGTAILNASVAPVPHFMTPTLSKRAHLVASGRPLADDAADLQNPDGTHYFESTAVDSLVPEPHSRDDILTRSYSARSLTRGYSKSNVLAQHGTGSAPSVAQQAVAPHTPRSSRAPPASSDTTGRDGASSEAGVDSAGVGTGGRVIQTSPLTPTGAVRSLPAAVVAAPDVVYPTSGASVGAALQSVPHFMIPTLANRAHLIASGRPLAEDAADLQNPDGTHYFENTVENSLVPEPHSGNDILTRSYSKATMDAALQAASTPGLARTLSRGLSKSNILLHGGSSSQIVAEAAHSAGVLPGSLSARSHHSGPVERRTSRADDSGAATPPPGEQEDGAGDTARSAPGADTAAAPAAGIGRGRGDGSGTKGRGGSASKGSIASPAAKSAAGKTRPTKASPAANPTASFSTLRAIAMGSPSTPQGARGEPQAGGSASRAEGAVRARRVSGASSRLYDPAVIAQRRASATATMDTERLRAVAPRIGVSPEWFDRVIASRGEMSARQGDMSDIRASRTRSDSAHALDDKEEARERLLDWEWEQARKAAEALKRREEAAEERAARLEEYRAKRAEADATKRAERMELQDTYRQSMEELQATEALRHLCAVEMTSSRSASASYGAMQATSARRMSTGALRTT